VGTTARSPEWGSAWWTQAELSNLIHAANKICGVGQGTRYSRCLKELCKIRCRAKVAQKNFG